MFDVKTLYSTLTEITPRIFVGVAGLFCSDTDLMHAPVVIVQHLSTNTVIESEQNMCNVYPWTSVTP
jgi:ABC-type glucose/galactose transport system permease subunit